MPTGNVAHKDRLEDHASTLGSGTVCAIGLRDDVALREVECDYAASITVDGTTLFGGEDDAREGLRRDGCSGETITGTDLDIHRAF